MYGTVVKLNKVDLKAGEADARQLLREVNKILMSIKKQKTQPAIVVVKGEATDSLPVITKSRRPSP